MADATLTIVATIPNGSNTRAAELQIADAAVQQAMQKIRGAGGASTSVTVATGFSQATASATYVPVASS
jgi:hypothetical protein